MSGKSFESSQSIMSHSWEEDSWYGSSEEQVRPSKRLRTDADDVPIHQKMTQERINSMIEHLVAMIVVEDGMFFNSFQNIRYRSSGFRLLQFLNPVFATKHLPNSRDLAGKHLDSFYDKTHSTVKDCIKRALNSGFCSLILNGWDNDSDGPVINVLLRTNGSSQASRNTFFLKSLSLAVECTDAAECVPIIELILEEYGGMEGIYSVTCDTTSICVNIKEALIQKHPRLVGLTDQTKASDKLVMSIERLPWVKKVILDVSCIIQTINNRSKLRERLWLTIHSHNELVEKSRSAPDKIITKMKKNVTSEEDDEMGSMSREVDPAGAAKDIPEDVAGVFMALGRRNRPTPVGAEEVIDAFLRLLTFLREMVNKPDFGKRLFPKKERENSQKATDSIIKLVNDGEFEATVRDVQKLLLLVGTYRRRFDDDRVGVSEILPLTLELEKTLESIPVTAFFHENRKTQALNVFKRLKDGEVGKETEVRLLQDFHYAAYLFNPHLAPDVVGKLMPRFRSYARAYAISRNYPNVDSYVAKLVLSYISQHAQWIESRQAPQDEDNISRYKGDELLYWNSGNCTDAELFELAIRTLSCSPKASKNESADYYPQKPLRSRERNLLSHEKMAKMLFCCWNVRMMRQKVAFTKDDFLVSVRRSQYSIASAGNNRARSISDCVLNRYSEGTRFRYYPDSDSEDSEGGLG